MGIISIIFIIIGLCLFEDKHLGLATEEFFLKNGTWFYAVVSAILVGIVALALKYNPVLALSAVIGSSAFTMSIPLIILGNGLGAIVVRKITMGSIEKIKKYIYLKNGAMYSVLCLGIVMVLEGFHVEVPEYISPSLTILIIIFFFFKSKIYAEKNLS